MAHYLVRARLKADLAHELWERLQAGAFDSIRPFGRSLSDALDPARRWKTERQTAQPLILNRELAYNQGVEGE